MKGKEQPVQSLNGREVARLIEEDFFKLQQRRLNRARSGLARPKYIGGMSGF